MCGRFVLADSENFYPRFKVAKQTVDIIPSFNIAPGMMVPVVIQPSEEREVVLMKWGLLPFWAKDEKVGYKMINARAETILETPSFRKPIRTQRCLVPANGFYEWQQRGGVKKPFYIQHYDGSLFAMAGIYESWENPINREQIGTFSIITTEPNAVVEPIHNRMPVILNESEEGEWINPVRVPEEVVGLLDVYETTHLEAYPVSIRVNDPNNNYPELLSREPLKTLF